MSFPLPTPVRLSALFFIVAWVGVDAQSSGLGASSVCDGAVTVTYVPPPFTVTVFTTGTYNVSDFLPDATSASVPSTGRTSLPGVTSLGTSDFDSSVPTLSPASVSVPTLSSNVPSTSVSLLSAPSDLITTGPLPSTTATFDLSLSALSASPTVPNLTRPPTITPGGILTSSDLADGLTTSFSSLDLSQSLPSITQPTVSSLDSMTLPDLTLSGTSPSFTVPTISSLGSITSPDLTFSGTSLPTVSSLEISSAPGISLTGSSMLSSLPTLSTPSITISGPTVPQTTVPTAQLSSLSNALSASVTLPGASLSSGLTTLIQSSAIPSLSSTTLSLSLPTLSLSGTLSDLSTSLAIPIGPSISLSSVTASPGLPTISPSSGLTTPSISLSSLTGLSGLPSLSTSGGLSTLSVSLPGGVPTLAPSPVSTQTSSLATPIPTASVLALVYCPSDDGMNYLSLDNRPYQVQCNTRRLGRTLTEDQASDLQSCMNSCDDVAECDSVSYNPSNGTCSREGDSSSGSPDNSFLSGSATDLSCPGAETTQYMDSTGSVYQVYCDYSFPQSSNITTSPADNYLDCSDTCSSTSTCTGFNYADGVCTFTQGFGSPPMGTRCNGTNTVVMLAKRVVRVGPDDQPIVDTKPMTSLPSLSISGISSPMTSITALPSTFPLPTISSVTVLPSTISIPTISSLTILPSTLSLPTISSITSLPSTLSLRTLTSITSLPSTISLPTITSIDASSLLNVTTILSIITPGTSPSLVSFQNSIISVPSATAPTSQGPTQTPISYSCPGNDGRVVMENGISYVLNCNSTTSGIAYSSKQVANSFNDCFRECDQSSVAGGANYCTAFTYEGAEGANNGAGSGTCYLYNGVSQGFVPPSPTGKKAISAIRVVDYIPDAVVSGVTYSVSALPILSLDSGLPTGTNLLSSLSSLSLSIPLPSVSVSATIAASVTVGAGVGVNLPSASISLSTPTTSGGILSTLSLSSPVTIPTSLSKLITTGTCNNGGNILNGCVLATATLDPGVGAGGGIVVGPSGSPVLGASLSASVSVSLSAGLSLGVGASAGSSGLSLGVSPSAGLGVGGGANQGGGAGLGGGSGGAATSASAPAQGSAATISPSARVSATPGSGSPSAPSPTTVSTTSYYVTSMGPVVTTTPSISTTWVYTTSTVTSCLTGAGGVLTCPLGGMFTTLPPTSGAVTSISTSTSIRTSVSVSVSVSISYITVTAPSVPTSTSLSTPLPLSLALPTSITSFSTRTSSSSSATSTATVCKGVVNAAGLCVL